MFRRRVGYLKELLKNLGHQAQQIDELRQILVVRNWGLRPDRSRNPLTAYPRRYWSQADEDGILEDILLRLDLETDGSFIEYGVGDGSECNTLVLLSKNWRGAWISGEGLTFTPHRQGRLLFTRDWITLENVQRLTEEALRHIGTPEVDVVSMDLDGNDYHLCRELLGSGLRPKVWICEYNARFPVGSHWVMAYDDGHTWTAGDYWGASLSAYAELFKEFKYFPVACSAQGSNVFFVDIRFKDGFTDVPERLGDLYQPPLYTLIPLWSNPRSARTLRSLTE